MDVRHRTLGLMLVAAVLTAACGARTGGVGIPASSTGGDRFPLADVTLATLDGEGTWSSRDLAGTPAVLNVWATWCAYCVEEMPDIEAVHRALDGRVAFVGVDRADDAVRARELAARTGVTYTLVSDTDDVFFRAVGARAMPTTVFVDAAGDVVHVHPGPLDAAGLTELIATHLGV